MPNQYIAIIGDLINSKKSSRRDILQAQLVTAFNQLNEKYSNIIVSKLTITLGDEFQVLLQANREIFQLIDDIQRLVDHPIRFGIGYGPITTEINPEVSLGADGPAYWHARTAIELLEHNNYKGVLRQAFVGLDKKDDVVNTLLLLTDTIRSGWTKTQTFVFDGLLAESIYQPTFNQKRMAEKLDLSDSAFSKRLQSGNIKIYLLGRVQLGDLLEEANH